MHKTHLNELHCNSISHCGFEIHEKEKEIKVCGVLGKSLVAAYILFMQVNKAEKSQSLI